MAKKEYVLGILHTLEQQKDIIPSHIQTTLQQVSEQISNVSADVFYLQTDRVATVPAQEQRPVPDSPLMELVETYDELAQIARGAGRDRAEFQSALNQLRGLLGTSDGYYPE